MNQADQSRKTLFWQELMPVSKGLFVFMLVLTLLPNRVTAEDTALSEDFLEFLVDFAATDQETFELVVENGKRDAQQLSELDSADKKAASGELKEVIQ